MVLEEATTPQEPASYTEALPSSDIDPYSGSTTDELAARPSSYIRFDQPGAREPLYINLAALPRPVSLFASTQRTQAITDGILSSCAHASKLLQRPLRQEEADAFAWHWAQSMRVASYGNPAGVSVAMLWAYRTKDYRFPGWSPMKSGRFVPDSLGPLKGSAARAGWNLLRYSAYGFVGMTVGSIFFASYALSLHVAHRAMDPRLKDFGEALKMRQQGKLMEAQREPAGKKEGETFEMARQRRIAQQQAQSQTQAEQAERSRQRQRERTRRRDDDDMSPTAGAFEEDFMDTVADTGLMSDGQSQAVQRRAENATSTLDTSRDNTMSQSQTRNADTRTEPVQQASKSGGSVWERLRQNAMSGNPSQPTSSPSTRSRPNNTTAQEASQSGDSFSFSQRDEDQQLARSEAQKQFDARIEREREGQDFNDSGGDGRRGRW